MPTANYTLTRKVPWREEPSTYPGLTRRQALQTMGEGLVDNRYMTKAEAQRLAAKVVDGEPVEVDGTKGKFVFTITKQVARKP